MKKSVIALLLVFGVSAAGSVFACETGHDKNSKSGTTPPAATPAK